MLVRSIFGMPLVLLLAVTLVIGDTWAPSLISWAMAAPPVATPSDQAPEQEPIKPPTTQQTAPRAADPSTRSAPTSARNQPAAAASTTASVTASVATAPPKPQVWVPPLPVRKPPPRPPTSMEGKFLAAMDGLLAPAFNVRFPKDEIRPLIQALTHIKKGNLQSSALQRIRITNPDARKLIDWYALRAGFGRSDKFAAFLKANPTWPSRKTLLKRGEEQVFVTGGSAASIMAYFKDFPPSTGAGYAALASAYLALNDKAEAAKYAAKAWRDLSLATTLETGFLKRFGPLLSIKDHRWRIDRLLLTKGRWRARRRANGAKIRRLIPLLPTAYERKKAKARLAVYLRSKRAKKLMAALAIPTTASAAAPTAATAGATASTTPRPDPPRVDWGLEFQRAQLLRRAKKHKQAWEILLSAPDDHTQLVNPDGWWNERRAGAYEALRAGNHAMAYELAGDPGPLSVNPRKNAAFMAGWIALRHLNEPKAAANHFKRMRDLADGPLSASKSAYWLARAMASFDPANATKYMSEAATYKHTFHGQLARQTLDPTATDLAIIAPSLPSQAQVERFLNLDAIKALMIAHHAGLRRSLQRAFFNHLRYYFTDQADTIMLAHLAQMLGDTQMALRIGKTGVARKMNLYYYAYPVHPLPDYSPLRKPPETAFLLGIARQESEFNTQIKSGAGARGLLQVMPITARHICTDYKLKCQIARLITDPTYNTMIASAYIADRMDSFKGSYVLTLSGYNAGPGRTRQWIRRFGDPRHKDRDTLDWIERVPFKETRNYIMKVLANIQIYRARLGMQDTALRLREDLARAKEGGVR